MFMTAIVVNEAQIPATTSIVIRMILINAHCGRNLHILSNLEWLWLRKFPEIHSKILQGGYTILVFPRFAKIPQWPIYFAKGFLPRLPYKMEYVLSRLDNLCWEDQYSSSLRRLRRCLKRLLYLIFRPFMYELLCAIFVDSLHCALQLLYYIHTGCVSKMFNILFV